MVDRLSCAPCLCAAIVAVAAFAAVATHAQAAQLKSVQTQALRNHHTRVIFQFDRPAAVRPGTGGGTTYVFQVAASTMTSAVAGYIPVNSNNVQNVTIAQQEEGLVISVALAAPVFPTLTSAVGNTVFIVDVPPASNARVGQQPIYGLPTPQPRLPTGGQQTRLFRLRYADVSEVVGVLVSGATLPPASIFNPQPTQLNTQPIGGFGSYGGFNQYNSGQFPTFTPQVGGGTSGEAAQLGQRINDNIAIDRRLNAVIVTGTADQIAQAETIIKAIDVPVRSVLLDAEVLEVTDSGAKALGLDFNQSTTQPITRVFNAQAAILNQLPVGAVPGALEFQSNLFLLVSKGLARVLASPKILTEDGQNASILTGDSLPIRVTLPVGFGGSSTVTSQVEYINVGVNLQILPHITGEHGVEAAIFSQVSSVTGFTSSNDPQISTRQAQTKVNLMEGETLVIGGLLQQRDIRNIQKIPLLGDLPLIGALFRFYTETRQNTNLVITITPHLVAAPNDQPAGFGPAASPTPAPIPVPPTPAPQVTPLPTPQS